MRQPAHERMFRRLRWKPKDFPTKKTQVRQEIHCHECNKYVQFLLDTSIDGNHVLNCPVCGHEHCRVVQKGKITDFRWDSRNGPTTRIVMVTSSTSAVYDTIYFNCGDHDTASNTFTWGTS